MSLALMAASASAEVKLPAVLGSHMVLQRDMPVPIRGTAAPGEKVHVRFRGQEKSATADAVIDGKTVVLSCNQVKHPVAACYGWGYEYPWAHQFNQDRLPAIPFLFEVNGPPTAEIENR
jgi:hypothetical protein